MKLHLLIALALSSALLIGCGGGTSNTADNISEEANQVSTKHTTVESLPLEVQKNYK
jgi:outer membrane biogenesis lipoprotein LolB